MAMLEVPYSLVLTLCLQIYILAAIFFLTCRLLAPKHGQIQTRFQRQDYATKRDLFIMYIGFFEMVFVLFVHFELSRHVLSVVEPLEERCEEIREEDDKRMNLLSYAVLVCILLSVIRCIVQSCLLNRLSKSDMVSVNRVYVLPSTILLALLCLRLWLHLHKESDSNTPSRALCVQAAKWQSAMARNSPVIFNLFILAIVVVNFMYDFAVSRWKQNRGFPSHGQLCLHFRRRQRSIMRQAETCTAFTEPGRPPAHYQIITLIHDYGQRSDPSLLDALETRTRVPTLIATPYYTSEAKEEKNFAASQEKSWRMYYPGDAPRSKVPSTCGSYREHLCNGFRMYLALAVYFVIFVGTYQYTEHLFAGSILEDFAPVIFTSIVIVNGLLRVVQIAYARTISNDEKTRGVMNFCKNQSTV